jgi:hypothetical protein
MSCFEVNSLTGSVNGQLQDYSRLAAAPAQARELWETIKVLGLSNDRLALDAITKALAGTGTSHHRAVSRSGARVSAARLRARSFRLRRHAYHLSRATRRPDNPPLAGASSRAYGVALPDERQQFEAKFPKPDAVTWTGSAYEVREGWENSYRIDRFLGQWEAWQAARGVGTSLKGEKG